MNQRVERDPKDVWLCKNCGEKIIPFETGGTAGIVEIGLVLLGLGLAIFASILLGAFLIILSLVLIFVFSNGKKKSCPSCESVDIVPALSPAAQKFERTDSVKISAKPQRLR